MGFQGMTATVRKDAATFGRFTVRRTASAAPFLTANISRSARTSTMTDKAGITASASIFDFQLCDCAHEGKVIRMFFAARRYPTSNFYRSWAIAREPPVAQRKNERPCFVGKLFRVLTVTVKPKTTGSLATTGRRGPVHFFRSPSGTPKSRAFDARSYQ